MTRLEAIRLAFDTAVAQAEDDGAAPEGLGSVPATRELRDEGVEGVASREARAVVVLREYETAMARVLGENGAKPRAA